MTPSSLEKYAKESEKLLDEHLKFIASCVNESGNGDISRILYAVAIERLITALGSAMKSHEMINPEIENSLTVFKHYILPRLLPAFEEGMKAAAVDPSIIKVEN